MSTKLNSIRNLTLQGSCQYYRPINDEDDDESEGNGDALIRVMKKKLFKMNEKANNEVVNELFDFILRELQLKHGFHFASRLVPTAIIDLCINGQDLYFLYKMLKKKLKRSQISSPSGYIDSSLNSYNLLVDKIADLLDIDEHVRKLGQNSLGFMLDQHLKANGEVKPLILFISNLEAFESSLLSNFLTVLRRNLSKIPVVLLCSISTDVIKLENIADSKALDGLLIQKFKTNNLNQVLIKIINHLFLSLDYSFKLGPKIMNHVLEIIRQHNCSVQFCWNILKYCLLDHYSKKIGKFCCPEEELEEITNKLSKKDISHLRALKSVSKIQFPTDIVKQREFVFESIQKIHSCHRDLFNNLQCLYCLIKYSGTKFVQDFCDLYIYALSCTSFGKSEELSAILKHLKLISLEEWQKRLRDALEVSSDLTNILEVYRLRLEKLNGIIEVPKLTLKLDFTDCSTRSEWRKKLANNIVTTKQVTNFDIWKEEICNDIKAQFESFKINPTQMPFNEVIYYDNLLHLREFTIPSSRSQVINDMKNMEETISDAKDKSILPVYSAFKIYEEGSTHINLRDWLESFRVIMDNNRQVKLKKSPKKKSKQDLEETLVTSQFFNIVSDFEFIGLIQPKKRKVDHVTKTVWE